MWARIVGEFVQSGLADALDSTGAVTFSDFDAVVTNLTVITPAQLSLVAGEYALGETFDQSAGNGRN